MLTPLFVNMVSVINWDWWILAFNGACTLLEVIELYVVEKTSNIPICFFPIAVDCGTLTNPANGQVTLTAGTTFGQTATYSCNTGYYLVRGSTRTCQATGVWSGSAPTCKGMLLSWSHAIVSPCAEYSGLTCYSSHVITASILSVGANFMSKSYMLGGWSYIAFICNYLVNVSLIQGASSIT